MERKLFPTKHLCSLFLISFTYYNTFKGNSLPTYRVVKLTLKVIILLSHMDLEKEVMKIQITDTSSIASLLSCSKNQAGKFRRGFSGLSNAQAQKLKEKLGLEPMAFNEIRKEYLIQKEQGENKIL